MGYSGRRKGGKLLGSASDRDSLRRSETGSGGGSGIRTRDGVAPIHALQACAFNRSATPPLCRRLAAAEARDSEMPADAQRDLVRPPTVRFPGVTTRRGLNFDALPARLLAVRSLGPPDVKGAA